MNEWPQVGGSHPGGAPPRSASEALSGVGPAAWPGEASYRELLSVLRKEGPMLSRDAGPRFVQAWRGFLDRCYLLPQRRGLDALLLNDWVAEHTAGPHAEAWRDAARANCHRLRARLGEEVGEVEPGPHLDEGEREWLRWLSRWHGSAGEPGDPTLAMAPEWRALLQAATEMAESTRAEALTRSLSHVPVRVPAATQAAWQLWERLARLRLAELRFRNGLYPAAAQEASRCGEEGELLQFHALMAIGAPPSTGTAPAEGQALIPPQRSRASYRAYEMQRLSQRCLELGLQRCHQRWSMEAQGWRALCGSGSQGSASAATGAVGAAQDPHPSLAPPREVSDPESDPTYGSRQPEVCP